MNFLFSIFPLLFGTTFLFVMGVIVYTLVVNIKQEHKNNHSPKLTVEAKVVAKRTNYRHHSGTNNHIGHTHTTYFVTFEVQSGDRMELSMSGPEYGLLVEGDWGNLTFQGTRYLGFQRKVKPCDL
ncbi:MAG: DUF2500 domain-containing protein [Oscillospiraceae bacterium]|nr:DUF2500 domain-containing protein [Oscillospiraceae bacterium]